jgi:selenocysteine-specific elongation factor
VALVIGTAGHIDHGKTALVRALTGQETDRLREERERGISIELGFAHFDGPDGQRTGVVDVPGHERFVRTMLAGAHGIDLVLFVVAADDGVMPQSEEHLDILHELGVRRGIFVITKIDLVDPRRIEAVREEIEILAHGTTLEGTPVVAVSATTGAGIPALRAGILSALGEPRARPGGGPFRLPVDRSFVMHGHGVVVTGTAVSGTVHDGDTVRILPGGRTARVRGVQVHGESVDRAVAGQRVAMNLAGVERSDVARGDVVCDPALARATTRLDAWVELRPSARAPLASHDRVRLHLGTAEAVAKVVLLDGRERLVAGEGGLAQVLLRRPVTTVGGDRFVIRDETARWTIGGGVVLAPFAERHRRGDPVVLGALALLHAGGPAAVAALLDLSPGLGESAEALALAQGCDGEAVRRALRLAGALEIPDGADVLWVPRDRWTRLEDLVVETIAAFHAREPLEPGIPLEEVRSRLPWEVPQRVFRWGVDRLVEAGRVAREGDLLRAPDHTVGLGGGDAELAGRVEQTLAVAGLTPPSVAVLGETLAASTDSLRSVLTRLERAGRVVRVATDLYFHPEAIEAGKRAVEEHCRAEGEITAAGLRDRIGASRKFAIAFLDWCDRTGFTTRVGDARRLRR